jgi:hypothetical protein
MNNSILRISANKWADELVDSLMKDWDTIEEKGSIGDSDLRRVSEAFIANTGGGTTAMYPIFHEVAFEAYRQKAIRK